MTIDQVDGTLRVKFIVPSTFTATFVDFTALQSAQSNSSVPFIGPHRTSCGL